MKPLDPTRHHAGRCQSEHIAWGPDPTADPIVAIGVGRTPARGTYAPGDWVDIHGRPGAAPGHRQWGMRGMVLGGAGGGYYYGITDDGRPWVERAGSLVPAGTPFRESCTCCPQPLPRKAKRAVGTQMDLFDALDVA